MSRWLLDTNVLSELARQSPAPEVVGFVSDTPAERLFVSVMTIAELRFGIATAPSPRRRDDLDVWLNEDVRGMFSGRVLALGEDVLLHWRLMARRCRRAGRTCSEADLLIAATADHHGLVLATRDTVFRRLDLVSAFDPWTGTTYQRQTRDRV